MLLSDPPFSVPSRAEHLHFIVDQPRHTPHINVSFHLFCFILFALRLAPSFVYLFITMLTL